MSTTAKQAMEKDEKSGLVKSFNVSPKGMFEGLLLETSDGIVQVNFPGDWSDYMVSNAGVGTTVTLRVQDREVHGSAAHPVCDLVEVIGGPPEEDERIEGTVERLNYALHGEVNGAVLDSGDFLHLKPHGAAQMELTVGMKVRGSGSAKAMPNGHRVIDAKEVNGITIKDKPKPKKKARH